MVVHRTLDGKSIHLSGPLDLTRPFTSIARVVVDARLHEFTAGEIAAGHAWADDLGIHSFTEQFEIQGGTLRLGHGLSHDPQTGLDDALLAAVWEGRRYAVFTHLYHARASDAVALFHGLTLTEHDDGIVITPGRRAAFAEPADLVKEVPGLGLLEITSLTKQTAQRLPSWPGAKVANGELFKDTLENQGIFFLLATGSALVTVLPAEDDLPAAVAGRLPSLAAEITY